MVFCGGGSQSYISPNSLVKIIRSCISTVSYKILLNGQPGSTFILERRLRQGDPLSILVYFMCRCSIRVAEEGGSFEFYSRWQGKGLLSPICFFEVLPAFCKANAVEADRMIDILSGYKVPSGQMVNMEKYEVSFSRNIPDHYKDLIRNRMRVKTMENHSKYLGLPVIFGRSKKMFSPLSWIRFERK